MCKGKNPAQRGFFLPKVRVEIRFLGLNAKLRDLGRFSSFRMNIRFAVQTASLGLLCLLSACAQVGAFIQPENPVLVELNDVSTGSIQTRPAVLIREGRVNVLHATKAGRVALQQDQAKKLIDETARVKRGGSYFQLKETGNHTLQALWWSHENGKNGYFTTSDDAGLTFSPVSMVNSDNQILQPITWVQGQNQTLGIAYHDERLPTYQVFFNRSLDGGRTWRQQDQRLDTPPPAGRSSFIMEPQMVQTNRAWVLAWVDTVPANDGAFRIIVRKSVDHGETWSQARTVYSATRHISALTVRAQNDQVAIVADELEKGVIAITSSDSGETWNQTEALSGTEHASNSGVEADLSANRLYITWMQERKDEKTRIFVATLDLQTKKWLTKAQRLDVKTVENTRSQTPTIIATKAGPLVTAWIDFRDIRSNIYFALSHDQGLTWTSPQPLNKPGEIAHGWPQLLHSADGAALAYEQYPTDRALEGRFVVQQLSVVTNEKVQKNVTGPSMFTETQRRARLEERIKSLWTARIAADFETAYDYFDFAYKAVTPKKHYIEAVGVITYLDAKLDTVAIAGNEAKVNMKLRYEVKPTIVPMTGNPISVPPVDVDSPNTWVWVKDNWYLVYHPTFDPPTLRY